jgi:hypothetical protein
MFAFGPLALQQYFLFHSAVTSHCMMLYDRIFNDWWIEKDLEGNSRVLV